jgi:putative NADH-flavin reductase
MRLTIFGATGKTGRHLVRQALDAGHEVVAFARTPSKLEVEDERLRVVQGDVREAERVAKAVAGADAVLSVLGPTSNEPPYEVTQGMRNIVAAMEEHGVRRLVQSVGAGVRAPTDEPGLFDRLIKLALKLFSRHVYEDMARMADVVRESGLDWTLVRVPMLTDEPSTGDLEVDLQVQNVGPRVSRVDMAAFILDQADDRTYVRQAPVISN